MSDTESGPKARIAIHVTPELKTRIEMAADLLGVTMADFVVSTLHQRASEVLAQRQTIVLSDRDRDNLLSALQRPGKPLPSLVATLEKARLDAGL